MNDKVDTRVVRMEFDNKQFEKNVKQTSKSLNDLKQNLDFKGVGDSLDKVRVKISALEVAATTFVVNLTNRLITLGVTITKSLSVDNIASGWEKFGNKTVSVATMMAQKIRIAGREITDMAERTEVVNKQLELLTWFSDETSYSFTDMVDNVGKFIAAGQDLDTSVKAMEGIANWAALSGQNAQTASRAMYQLAQAMGKGKVVLQDWMSIQNANMDTEKFRETILATAVSMGKLTKEGDKFITKTGKKFTQSEFTKYLSEGWFTSDVLIAGLGKYSAAVEQIYALANRDGITASAVIEKYGDQLDEFGVEAFKAAQEARTFTDVLNSIKDAVSSKWMTTFEEIFGGKDESIKTWTELANELYDVFAESGNFRNNMLSIWSDMGGRNDIFGKHGDPNQGAFWNLYDAIIAVKDLIASAWNTIFPISEMEDENDRAKSIARTLKNLTETLKRATEQWKNNAKQATLLRKIFEGLFSILRLGLVTIQAIRYVLEPVFDTLKSLASQVLNRIVSLTGGLDNILMGIVDAAEYLRARLEDIIEIINPSNVLNTVFSVLKNIWAVIKEINPIERLFSLVESILKGLRDGGGTVNAFGRIVKNLLQIGKSIISVVLSIAKALSRYLLPILETVTNIVGYLLGFVAGIVTEAVALVSDILASLDNLIQGIDSVADVGGTIKDFLAFIPRTLQVINPLLIATTGIIKALVDAIVAIPKILDAVSVRLTGKGILENLKSFFDNFSSLITYFVESIRGGQSSGEIGTLRGLIDSLALFFDGLKAVLAGLISSAQALITVLGSALKTVGAALKYISTVLIKIFTGKWKELSSTTRVIIETVLVVGGLIAALYILYNVLWGLAAAINPFATLADSLATLFDRASLSLRSFAIETFSEAAIKFAAAIWILVAALKKIDGRVLAAIAIVTGLVALFLILKWFLTSFKDAVNDMTSHYAEAAESVKEAAKKVKSGKEDGLSQISKVLNAIANALLKIALVAVIFDRLKFRNEVFAQLIAILGVLAATVVALSLMSAYLSVKSSQLAQEQKKDKSLLTVAAIITTFVASIRVLVGSMKVLNGLNPGVWKQGVILISVVAGSIVLLLGMVAVLMSTINKKSTAISGSKAGNSVRTITSVSLLMLSLSTALTSVAGSIYLVSRIDPDRMMDSLMSLVGLLAAVALVVAFISKIGASDRGIAGAQMFGMISGSILALSASLYIMAKAIDTLAGKGPEITQFFANIGYGIVALVSALLSGVGTWIGQLLDILETYVPRIVDFVVNVVIQILQAVADNIGTILELVGRILNAVLTFSVTFIAEHTSTIVSAIVQVMHILITSLAENLPTMVEDIMTLVTTLLDVILPMIPMMVGKIISSLLTAFGQQALTEEEVQAAFGSVFQAIGTLLRGIMDILVMLGPVVASIIDLIIEIINAINWQVIIDVLTTFIGILASLLPPICSILDTIFRILGPIIITILKILGPILEIILKFVERILKVIEFFVPVIEMILNTIGALVQSLVAIFTGDFKKLGDIWKNWWNNIVDGANQMNQRVMDAVKNFVTNLINKARELGKKIGTWLAERGKAFKEFVTSLPGKVWEWIKELFEKVKNIGKNIVNGIRDGITEGWENLKNKVKETGEKIKNWFTDTFKIHSPSKVFAQYGEFMMEGLAVGLDDGVKEQRSAMQNTLSTLSNSLENYLDVNEDDITIKVGMDISGVEEQSRNVRGIMSSISNYNGSISGAYGASASSASGEISKASASKARAKADEASASRNASSYTDNTTNNNVFNIQSSKPKEVAEEVDKILQERVLSKKLARGGI